MKQKTKLKLTQPKQRYFNIGLVIFAVAFICVGVTLEILSHADTQTNVRIGSGYSGYCMDDYQQSATAGNKIDIYTCNTTPAQQWTVDNTNEKIMIKGLCVGTVGNSTAQNTGVVLANCSSNATQQWLQESSGNLVNLGSNKKCLNASSKTLGTQLTIVSCSSSFPAGQMWSGGPTPPAPAPSPQPAPSPSPSPSPAPSPSPSPVPSPKAAPKPTPTSSLSVSTPTSSALNTSSTTSTPSTNSIPETQPDTTLTNASAASSSSVPPIITRLAVRRVTSTSATISWAVNVSSTYTIRYGTNQDNLSSTTTYASTNTAVTVTLNNLPPGKAIYLAVSPTNGGTPGNTKSIAFKTPSNGNTALLIILSVGFLAVVGGLVILKLRGSQRASSMKSKVVVDLPPPFPKEDAASFEARVNWWQPRNVQQLGNTAMRKQRADDDITDMFEEGNRRLTQEEQHRHKP